MKKIFLIILIIFSFVDVNAQTAPIVYVAGDGSGDFNCDGTSDQIEINQALDYVATNPGFTTVYLKGPHTYYVDETIFISSNTIFTGDSTAKIELIQNAGWWTPGKPIIAQKGRVTQWNFWGDYGDDISNVEIFGFEISGGLIQEEPSGGTYIPIIHFCSPHNVSIHDMHLHDSHWDIVRLTSSGGADGNTQQDCNHTKVYNNIIEFSGHEGICFVTLKNFEVYNNTIYSTRTNCGIRLKDTDNFDVHDNIIGNSLLKIPSGFSGILVENKNTPLTLHAEIFNNIIYGKNGGIHLGSDDVTGNDPYPFGTRINVHIHHNKIYKTRDAVTSTGFLMNSGITIAGYDHTLIEHNIIDGSTIDGIVFKPELADGTGYQTIVRNNIIMNVTGNAINNMDASIHTFISDNNLFYNNTTNYVNANSTTDIYDNPLFPTEHTTYNQWHHIVATYSNTTEMMKIYVDGKEKASREITGFGAIASNTYDLLLGSYLESDYWFEGREDEVAIWDRALSYNEVNQLYNNGTPVDIQGAITSGLQAYYKMENNWDDSSGNGFNVEYSTSVFTTDAICGNYSGLFDGVDDVAQYPYNLSLTNGLSISDWVYSTGLDDDIQTIVSKGGESNNDHFWLYLLGEYVMFEIGNGTTRDDIEAFVIKPDEIDYHIKSEYGRWNGSSWVNDAVTSPCVDGGYLSSDYSNEPVPNGGRVNIGVYGNTDEASKSDISTINSIEENHLIVYPNATSGIIYVDRKYNNNKYEITSISGTVVKSGNIESNTINLSELDVGVYFIRIFELKLGKINVAKIIKE